MAAILLLREILTGDIGAPLDLHCAYMHQIPVRFTYFPLLSYFTHVPRYDTLYATFLLVGVLGIF